MVRRPLDPTVRELVEKNRFADGYTCLIDRITCPFMHGTIFILYLINQIKLTSPFI
jgi:hypothetical protein